MHGSKRMPPKGSVIVENTFALPANSFLWETTSWNSSRKRKRRTPKMMGHSSNTYRRKGCRESMVISGAWRLCDDGILRPILSAKVRTATGAWVPIDLLVDVGADRTVFSAGVLDRKSTRLNS